MTKQDQTELFIDTLNLELEQTHRGNCPGCMGVNTFVATRHHDGKVTYFCYRPSCGVRGALQSVVRKVDVEAMLTRVNAPHETLSTKFVLPDYVVMNVPLSTHEDLRKYVDRYPWVMEWEDVRWDARDNRLVHIIKDSKGNMLDAIGRAVNPRRGQPKTKVYGKGEHPLLAQSVDPKGNSLPKDCYKDLTVVIVEDINSALRLNAKANIDACAINGTYLRDSFVPYLLEYDTCVIVLDGDATAKAVNMHRQLLQYTKARWLPAGNIDIKDMNDELFGRTVDFILEEQE